jgi:hypothetical protein
VLAQLTELAVAKRSPHTTVKDDHDWAFAELLVKVHFFAVLILERYRLGLGPDPSFAVVLLVILAKCRTRQKQKGKNQKGDDLHE